MTDVWYTTDHPTTLVGFRDDEMYSFATDGHARPWCTVHGIRRAIELTPTRDRIDLDRWILTVPERIRGSVATIAFKVFELTVAGKHSTPAVLDEYASVLSAVLWRHYNRSPRRGGIQHDG